MEKIIEILYDISEINDFDKLIRILMSVVSLVAPSTSIIFICERELFLTIEFSKLIIICLILNLVFFIIVYSLNSRVMLCSTKHINDELNNYMSEIDTVLKEGEKLCLDNKETENNLSELSAKVEGIRLGVERCKKQLRDLILKSFDDSVMFMSHSTVAIWVIYLLNYFIDLENELLITFIFIAVSLAVSITLEFIKIVKQRSKSEKH